MFKKDEVVKMLKESVKTVTFTKRDGTTRVMKASLLKEHLDDNVQSTFKRAPNPDVVCCIDVEKNDWRSFRLDSIVSIE